MTRCCTFVFCCHFYHKKEFCRTFRFQLKKKFVLFPAISTAVQLTGRTESLVEPASSQVVGDDHIRHGIKDKLNVLSVGGAGHVTVDLLRGRLVLGLELSLDVGCGLSVLLGPCTPTQLDMLSYILHNVSIMS